MPLPYQTTLIPLTRGIDTRTDPKTLQPGVLTRLENASFRAGTIEKRWGYEQLLTGSVDGNNPLSTPLHYYSLGSELLLHDGEKLWTYIESIGKWTLVDRMLNTITTNTRVDAGVKQKLNSDSAVMGDLVLTVYEEQQTDGTVYLRYSIYDRITGAWLTNGADANAPVSTFVTVNNTRCIACQGYFVIVYHLDDPTQTVLGSNELRFARINPSQPLIVSNFLTINNPKTPAAFDLLDGGDELLCFYSTRAGGLGITNSTKILKVNVAAGTSETVELNAAIRGSNVANLRAFFDNDDSTRIWLFQHRYSDTLITACATNRSGAVGLGQLTASSPPAAPWRLTGTDANGAIHLVYEITGSTPSDSKLISTYYKKSTSGSLFSSGSTLHHLGLASHAFVAADRPLVNVNHDSLTQNTYFTIDYGNDLDLQYRGEYSNDRKLVVPIAQVLPKQAGQHRLSGSLASVHSVPGEDNTFIWSNEFRSRIEVERSDEGLLSSELTLDGVNLTTLQINPNVRSIDIAGSTHIPGSVTWAYDGLNLVEQGFLLSPENLSSSLNATTGAMDPGTYQFSFTYEWTDRNGRDHYSAPSIPSTVTLTQTGSVDWTVPTLPLTRKRNVRLVGYRSLNLDQGNVASLMHRFTPLATPVLNDASLADITIQSTESDDDIETAPFLYTDLQPGSILANDPLPPSSHATIWQNRLVTVASENDSQVAFTKRTPTGVAVECSDEFRLDFAGPDGAVTAVAVLDDKLIVFKREAIYVTNGQGPNELGVGTFNEPVKLPTDIGCPYPSSVVVDPAGIFFKSSRGIYLLDRSLSLKHVGLAVESLDSQTVVGTDTISPQQQVRWTHSDGQTLVYDTSNGQWSSFTGLSGSSAIVVDGIHHVLTNDGRMIRELSGSYADSGGQYSLLYETGWIALAGPHGQQRIRRMSVLGDVQSATTLIVSASRDHLSTYTQSGSMSLNTLGTTRPDWHLKTQKCRAIRFVVHDSGSAGPGFKHSSLALEWKSKAPLEPKRNGSDGGIR